MQNNTHRRFPKTRRGMLGGFGAPKAVDDEVTKLVTGLQADVEKVGS